MAGSDPHAKPKEHLTIIQVDQERHTIHLNVDGCPVTLVCFPQDNPEPYQQVKTILLDTVVNSKVIMPQNKAKTDISIRAPIIC